MLLGVPVVLGVVALFFSLSLRQYQAVFLLLVAAHTFAAYMYLPGVWGWVLLAAAVAEIAHFVALGFRPENVFLSWYKGILTLGLFPWYWSWKLDALFLGTLVIVYGILVLLERTKGFRPSAPALLGGSLISVLLGLAFGL